MKFYVHVHFSMNFHIIKPSLRSKSQALERVVALVLLGHHAVVLLAYDFGGCSVNFPDFQKKLEKS